MIKSSLSFFVLMALLLACRCFAQGNPTAFQYKIMELGIDMSSLKDYSLEKNIKISTPKCAYINITNVQAMPSGKNDNLHAMMEVYDCHGGYFCKKVVINAQGNSTMLYPKKNFSADFCEDEWVGESTSNISIGDWVKQNSFHFKAYYIDTFRGISVVGYKIFADMLTGKSTYQERAGISNYDRKARCFPDGFPCIVYLNGEFYGIFSWELKKHRKNMSLEKSVATNIHLDGCLNNNSLWNDSIRWNQFEVRNPKNLYSNKAQYKDDVLCDAKRYDGDNPDELIDEYSEYYDSENEYHVISSKVKAHILDFSNYVKDVNSLAADGTSPDDIKKIISEHFDVPGMIDYIVFSLVTANYDGFAKNWQWFTYDAIKWFVAPYDLDCILGHNDTGLMLVPAEWTEKWSTHTMQAYFANGPMGCIMTYFMPEIKARYAELRDQKILTTERFMEYLHQWSESIGKENYEQEWKRWNTCRANSQIIPNDKWEIIEGYDDYFSLDEYDANRVYQAGDRCIYNNAIWRTTETVSDIVPAKQMGYTDTFERVEDWLRKRFELEDEYLEYRPGSASIHKAECRPDSIHSSCTLYNVAGQKVQCAFPGINIVKENDNRIRKVFVGK